MKKFYLYGGTLCKIAASMDKNDGNEIKHRLKRKYFIFLMNISRKLTFWNWSDVKKSKDKNELLHNVTYNPQMLEGH
jgi:DNA/RNA endonuclease G (NUC1)